MFRHFIRIGRLSFQNPPGAQLSFEIQPHYETSSDLKVEIYLGSGEYLVSEAAHLSTCPVGLRAAR